MALKDEGYQEKPSLAEPTNFWPFVHIAPSKGEAMEVTRVSDPFAFHAAWITLTRQGWLVYIAALGPRNDADSVHLRRFIESNMSPDHIDRPEFLISLSMSQDDLQALAVAGSTYFEHIMKI